MIKILRLLDKNKIPVKGLVNYSDLCVENTIDMNDKTLTFTSPLREVRGLISPECYIETRDDIFVVKEINLSTDGTVQVSAQLDLEELEGKSIHSFKSTEQTIDSALRLAFAGTGWTIAECTVTKKRTLSLTNVSALEVLKQAINTYMCEITIDSKAKTISIYDKIGEDRGVYFTSQLNLKKLTVQSTSYDFYTEIEPYGKDGMTIEEVNDGKTYVENHQYSDKKKRYIWKDERYTIAENMKADAIEKLADMSKPYSSYSADIIDLSRASDNYSILAYGLGDTVTLMDGITETREKQRIVGIKRYPNDPSKDTCTLANKVLTFDEMAQKYEQTSSTVDNITNDNGTIDGDTIDGIYTSQIYDLDSIEIPDIDLDNLEAQYVEISGKLTAVEADIGELNANLANIDQAVIGKLDADYAEITYAKITDLDAAHASIGNLEAETANIKSLLAGNAGIGDLQAINLSSANVNIADATITDAMIASLTANKITAGTIYTNRVTIQSGESDDSLWISGSVIQMSDQNRVRVQIGKDAGGTYNFYIWDANGNLMWNALGVTGSGLNDGIIVDKNVADNAAINGSKLDIQSVAEHLMDDGTLVIDSSRVKINDQTLSAVYTTITQSVTGLRDNVSTLQTSLNVVQGQISSKVWMSDISTATDELGNEITTLTDQYSALVQTQSSLSAKVSSLETTSTSHTAQIADLQVTVDGFSSKVSSAIDEALEGYVTQDYVASQISQTTDSITTTVESTLKNYATNSSVSEKIEEEIGNIQIGGRNLFKNSEFSDGTSSWNGSNSSKVSVETLDEKTVLKVDTGTAVTSSAYGVQSIRDDIELSSEYIASAFVYVENAINVAIVIWYDSGGWKEIGRRNFSCQAGWNRIYTPFKSSSTVANLVVGFGADKPNVLYIYHPKLEKGNVATDWTPAPEDYATATSVASQIAQSYESINLTLQQDYATKASLALQLNTDTGVATLAAAADRIELTSGQLVIKSGGLTLDSDGNAVFKGQITSSAGSIGGWTIGSNSLSSQSGGMTLKSSGVITSTDGTRDMELSSSKIVFSKSGTRTGVVAPISWDEDNEGVMFATTSKYATVGVSDDGQSWSARYIANNGLNPDGYNEDNILIGRTRIVGSLNVGGSETVNGSLTVTNNERITNSLYMGGSGSLRLVRGTYGSNYAVFTTGGGFYAQGDLGCSGTKARVVDTTNYGKVCLNAFEMPTPYFGDVGSGTIGENGETSIFIDPIFYETIETGCDYLVYLTNTSEKCAKWVERHQDHFTVYGDPGATFCWMMCSVQKGYSDTRTQSVLIQEEENDSDSDDYVA